MLWSNGDWNCRIPVASPIHFGGGKVFVSGGYGAGAGMFQVRRTGNRFEAKTLYITKECNGQIHQPLLYKGYLYMNGNDKGKKDGLMCMDLNGKVQWKTGRSPGFDWGGLLLADDRIYTVDGNTGDLCMVKPDPTGYQELGRAKFLGGEQIWGTVALSDGKLLIRDQSQLKCIDIRGG